MRRLIDNGNRPITPKPHIGHYGRLRKAYLEQYRHRLYTALVASEKLYPHLAETDRAARDMLDYLMPRLAREAGATEALKAADPMKWVGLMNNCKARAEEIVMHTSIGQRLKFVRRFRRLTQKELGLLMGYSEKTADVRIAQYEKNARTPNAETTAKLAEVLKVSPVVFSPTICASREDLLQSMYWLFLMKGGGDIYDCETEYARSRMEQKLGVITVEEFLEKILVN